jgi:hypothetical protein
MFGNELDKALVGETIVDVRYDKGDLYFNLSSGECIKLTPEGDCCASCYIQHISGTDALKNKGSNWLVKIASVEDIESEPSQEELDEYHEQLDCWGHRITTNLGVCSIEMRCSHNGYYCGWLGVTRLNHWSSAPIVDDF